MELKSNIAIAHSNLNENIRTSVLEDYDRTAPENFEDITTKYIQNIATKLLDNHKSYEVVFKSAE